MARHDVGDRIVLTARVLGLPDPRATILGDIDLPGEGLLVLGERPASMHLDDLVNVTGDVVRFSFASFAPLYGLTADAAYADFEGRKCVQSSKIRSWA